MSFPALSALAIAIRSTLVNVVEDLCFAYDPQDYVARWQMDDIYIELGRGEIGTGQLSAALHELTSVDDEKQIPLIVKKNHAQKKIFKGDTHRIGM